MDATAYPVWEPARGNRCSSALALGIHDSTRVRQVRQVLGELRRMVPGGELAQVGLRDGPAPAPTPRRRP